MVEVTIQVTHDGKKMFYQQERMGGSEYDGILDPFEVKLARSIQPALLRTLAATLEEHRTGKPARCCVTCPKCLQSMEAAGD